MKSMRRLQLTAIGIIFGGSLSLLPSNKAEAAAMNCPENILLESCDSIPPSLVVACDACGRVVGCLPLWGGGAVAGCDHDT